SPATSPCSCKTAEIQPCLECGNCLASRITGKMWRKVQYRHLFRRQLSRQSQQPMKERPLVILVGLAGWMAAAPLAALASDTPKTSPPPAPPLPAIRALKLEPSSLTLKGGRDEQRVLVHGIIEGDKHIDLTSEAR